LKLATREIKSNLKIRIGGFLVSGLFAASCSQQDVPRSTEVEDLSLRVAHLEDYAWQDRRQTGQPVDLKPLIEREALLEEITENPSELLVLRGLGSQASLLHLQSSLKDAGAAYPHLMYIPGSSIYQGIGFLSKKMFSDSMALTDQTYRIKEQSYQPVAGGVLLSTTQHPRLWIWNSQPPEPSESYERRRNDARILAATLKSQMQNGDSVLLSMHSREEIDSPMFRMIEEIGLKRIIPLDEQGDSWTHRDPQGILYQQDQWIFVSPEITIPLPKAIVFDTPALREVGNYRHQGLSLP